MENINIFSERLKIARQNAKLTQKQLADMSNVTAATISSYESENGTKVPALDKVIAIAKALNVSVDWLCGLDNIIKENENIQFNSIMKALVLLLTIKGVKFEKSELDDHECISELAPFANIKIYSATITNFLCEYTKISDFINDSEYPQYLKDGLLKAVFDKFDKYYVEYGCNKIVAENEEDFVSDGSDLPF